MVVYKSLFALFGLAVFACSVPGLGQANLLNGPEGIAYDSVYNRYLVANWNNGRVVAIDSTGVQSYFALGLGNCASVIISGDTVFVACNNNSVVGLDLTTSAMLMQRKFTGAGGCHDMAVDTSGYLYATDWGLDQIYRVRLSDNSYTVFVRGMNGLLKPMSLDFDALHNRLLVTTWIDDGPIQAIQLPDGTVSNVVYPHRGSFEGITRDPVGNYYFSTIGGSYKFIYRMDSSFAHEPELLAQNLNGLVDMCFNPRKNILAATVYNDNAVIYLPLTGSPRLEDFAFVDESGDGDGIPEGGETVEMRLQIVNAGVDTMQDLTLTLKIDDPTLNIIDGTTVCGDVPEAASFINDAEPFIIDIPVGFQPRIVTVSVVAAWNSDLGLRCDTLVLSVNIEKPPILLFDDDGSGAVEQQYTTCLENAEIPYDVWTSPPAPSYDDLAAYDIVIWFTGAYRTGMIDADEVAAMTAYLDAGGKLFLTGQGIAAQLNAGGYSDFLQNYLKSSYVATELVTSLGAKDEGQVFRPDDSVLISGSGGAGNQTVPDHLQTANGGVKELYYVGRIDVGAVSYVGSYKLVFFGFGFESIVNGNWRWIGRDTAMARILDFFDYQTPARPMTLTVAPGDPTHLVSHAPEISWFYNVPEPPSQEMYHVQVGADAEWSTPEMWDSGPTTGSETSVVYSGADLVDGQVYYYRVRVSDGATWSLWQYGQFRMNTAPTIPSGLSPDSMHEINDTLPWLSHTNAADTEEDTLWYSYEVYDDSLLSTLVAHASGQPEGLGGATSWRLTVALLRGEDYFWRVRAGDGYEYGPWSATASFFLTPAYICGDVNGDGQTNVGDAVYLINFVFKGGLQPDPLCAGDANADDGTNVGDAVYLINYVFKGGPAPMVTCCP
jgi:hypothetical protein